ncbi:gluconate 2-dehydrogenase subunit 3 family protein [Aliikangiella sp. IMCC44653]
MLKRQTKFKQSKRGSRKPAHFFPLAKGLNRRAFLRGGSAATLGAALLGCHDKAPTLDSTQSPVQTSNQPSTFNSTQTQIITQVQQLLFPDDGNGPSAKDLNAMGYLEFAMSDTKNQDDGDPEFLKKGVGWLQDLAKQTQGEDFLKLTQPKQQALLEQIAQSSAGENWLSLLLYYINEALTLDPIYGGNPNQVGWHWLEHQAGFPRPEKGKTYRDFD